MCIRDRAYKLQAVYGRRNYDGLGSPYVIAGIDFYDSNGNKLGDASFNLDKEWRDSFKDPGPALDLVDFSTPIGTTRSVVWVWAEPTGASDAYVTVAQLFLRPN